MYWYVGFFGSTFFIFPRLSVGIFGGRGEPSELRLVAKPTPPPPPIGGTFNPYVLPIGYVNKF